MQFYISLKMISHLNYYKIRKHYLRLIICLTLPVSILDEERELT